MEDEFEKKYHYRNSGLEYPKCCGNCKYSDWVDNDYYITDFCSHPEASELPSLVEISERGICDLYEDGLDE